MARKKSPWGWLGQRGASRNWRNPFTRSKPEDTPAPRKPGLEQLLCEAIKKRVLVSLYYEGDMSPRTFGASVVYRTTKDKVCVFGIQVGDGPHNFEVGKIRSASLTTSSYQPEPINRLDRRYEHGIICSA